MVEKECRQSSQKIHGPRWSGTEVFSPKEFIAPLVNSGPGTTKSAEKTRGKMSEKQLQILGGACEA
jgi:hypothetical protein